MAWLAVTDEQRTALQSINTDSVRVNVIRGNAGGWLVNADAAPDAVPGGLLEAFADWYAALVTSDDVPAPRPRKPR
jgi:hypothetical protein